jgi:hypothetical protein
MAGRVIPAKAASITAASSTGYITIASVTGWYAGAKAYLNNGGQTNRHVIITEVLTTGNQLGIRFIPDFGTLGAGPNYGRNNVAAYNGGTIDMYEQFLFNPNDKPLD